MTIIGVLPRGFRHPMENAGASSSSGRRSISQSRPNFTNVRSSGVLGAVARLKPGRTDRRGAARARRAARALVQPVSRRLFARGRLARRRRAAVRATGRQGPAGAADPARRGGLRAAHRLRQRRQPAAGARPTARRARSRSGPRWAAAAGRIVRQLLTESLLLAAVGGLLGLLLALWGTSGLSASGGALPAARRRDRGRSFGAGVHRGLIVLTGVGFGLLPALQASRPDLQSVSRTAARDDRRRPAPGQADWWYSEVALALVLLAGAGLLLRSFERLLGEPGSIRTACFVCRSGCRGRTRREGRYFTPARLAFYDRTARGGGGRAGASEVALSPASQQRLERHPISTSSAAGRARRAPDRRDAHRHPDVLPRRCRSRWFGAERSRRWSTTTAPVEVVLDGRSPRSSGRTRTR